MREHISIQNCSMSRFEVWVDSLTGWWDPNWADFLIPNSKCCVPARKATGIKWKLLRGPSTSFRRIEALEAFSAVIQRYPELIMDDSTWLAGWLANQPIQVHPPFHSWHRDPKKNLAHCARNKFPFDRSFWSRISIWNGNEQSTG